MATIAKWRTGNTRPGVRVPLDLGIDPTTSEARVLAGTDDVTLIMRNDTLSSAAQVRACDVESLDPPVVTWKPEDGDFDNPGTYDVVFDITDVAGDVETIPNDHADDYSFLITSKPGES
jgi:hypothetical protein